MSAYVCVCVCGSAQGRSLASRAGQITNSTQCMYVCVCALQKKAFGLFTALLGLGLRKFRSYNRLAFVLAYVFIISVWTLNSPHASHVLSTGLQTVELIINYWGIFLFLFLYIFCVSCIIYTVCFDNFCLSVYSDLWLVQILIEVLLMVVLTSREYAVAGRVSVNNIIITRERVLWLHI